MATKYTCWMAQVLIFDCRLDHTAAPNTSDDARMFVQVRYGAQWYADACRKNHAGSLPADVSSNKSKSDDHVTVDLEGRMAKVGVPAHSTLPAEVLAEIPSELWPRFGH